VSNRLIDFHIQASALVSAVALAALAGCQPAPLEAEVDGAMSAAERKAAADAEAYVAALREARRPLDPATVVKVALYRDGRVEIDGAPAEAEQIAAKMKSAAASKKSVVYYREDAAAGLSPQQKGAMPAILGAVAENLLPIRFSLNPDFSDTVLDKETTRTP
jgi:hypothetical protein